MSTHPFSSSHFPLTHPHPPHARWRKAISSLRYRNLYREQLSQFLSVPFSFSSSSFSLSSSSSLAWQGKEWGQGRSDITPCVTGQHSLCPPSHTVKYIDVGTWPVPREGKKERERGREREDSPLFSPPSAFLPPCTSLHSPSVWQSSLKFRLASPACLIIRGREGLKGRKGLGRGESMGVEKKKKTDTGEEADRKMQARWQFTHHLFSLDTVFFFYVTNLLCCANICKLVLAAAFEWRQQSLSSRPIKEVDWVLEISTKRRAWPSFYVTTCALVLPCRSTLSFWIPFFEFLNNHTCDFAHFATNHNTLHHR